MTIFCPASYSADAGGKVQPSVEKAKSGQARMIEVCHMFFGKNQSHPPSPEISRKFPADLRVDSEPPLPFYPSSDQEAYQKNFAGMPAPVPERDALPDWR